MRGRASGFASRFARRRRLQALVAASVAGVIAAAGLSALPAAAATHPAVVNSVKPVAGHLLGAASSSVHINTTAPAPLTRLVAGTYKSSLPAESTTKATIASHTIRVGGWKTLGSTGIAVSRARSTAKTASKSTVTGAQVSVVGSATVAAHHAAGLMLRINRTDSHKGAGPVAIRIPTKLLDGLYGADYAGRTTWVSIPASGTTSPTAPAAKAVPESTDAATHSIVLTPQVSSKAVMIAAVSATTSSTGTGSFAAPAAAAPAAAAPVPAAPVSAAPVAAAPAAAAATSSQPATQSPSALQAGAFTWQYPIVAPPAAAGPAPKLALSYDSHSVDGETGSTNNQADTVGDGFSMAGTGYIQQSFVPCAQDDGSSGAVKKSGDLCWKSSDATIDFDGHTGVIIKDAKTGLYSLQSDDGSRLEHVTGTGEVCPTFNSCPNDYWRLTTLDGTQYYFGKNQLPGWGAGKPVTNSVWTVPVFGNDAGEPCHGSTFAASACYLPWRWNLDYVVDAHSNAEAYYYDVETNSYEMDGVKDKVYDRGGQLDHIDYGLTSSTVYASDAASDRIAFGYDAYGRCSDATDKVCTKEPITGPAVVPAKPTAYPDVPFDQLCRSTTSCAGHSAPSFWTDGMLDSITTSVRSGTTYGRVDVYTLAHTFPAPGDGTSAAMLLSKVVHTGYQGTASLAEPPVTFSYSTMQNRVWTDGLAPLDKYRISSILSATGAVTSVNYARESCPVTNDATAAKFIAAAASNTSRCFPQWWQPPVTLGITPAARFDVFTIYPVVSVITDPKTGGAYDSTRETDYTYPSLPAWRYDTTSVIPGAHRTWSDFAGYSVVEVRQGDSSAPSAQKTTDYTFYRGLDGDRAGASGGAKSVSVTGSPGTPDSLWLAGQIRETTVRDGVGRSVVSDQIDTPWAGPVVASDGKNVARIVAAGEQKTTEPVSSGGVRSVDVKTTRESTSGLPTSVSTVTSDAGSTCTTTSYAAVGASRIVDLPTEQATVGVACADLASAVYPKDAVSDVRTDYDGLAFGAAALEGDATTVQTVDSYAGSTAATAHWATTATNTYDTMGRLTGTTDVLGHTTTTAYTPATGGPLTQEVQTAPAPLSWPTTTVVDPARGDVTSSTDARGLVTTTSYDAFGRPVAEWLPGHPSSSVDGLPSIAHTYKESQTSPSAVQTDTLVSSGLVASFDLYDGLGDLVQSQRPSPARGTIATDTAYDSQGRVSSVNNPYWEVAGNPSTTLFVPGNEQNISSETVTDYDAVGRTTATVLVGYGTERSRTSFTYKGADEVDTTPPSGGTPSSTFTNSLGEKTAVVQYLAAAPTSSAQKETTKYGYDASGRETSKVDPAGNAWTWQFDVLGHTVAAVAPDAGTTTSTYDDAGELLSTTDARGQELSYTYDAAGRKTAEYSGSTTGSLLDSWTYDTLQSDQLTSSASYVGSTPGAPGTAYTTAVTGYGTDGRPQGSTVSIPASAPAFGGTSYTTRLVYNEDGTLVDDFEPAIGGLAAERVTQDWDSGEYFALSGNSDYAQVVYDATGQIAQINRDGQASNYSTYSYDSNTGQVIGIDDATGTGSANVDQLDHEYVRDAAGNITEDRESQAQGTESQCYAYDQLQQLTSAWTPSSGSSCTAAPSSSTLGGSAPYWDSYTYDPATGNRLTSTEHASGLATGTGSTSDETDTYAYPASGSAGPHEVQSISSSIGGQTATAAYGYDADGNTTSRPGQTLTYDAQGRLSTVTTAKGTQTNVYDADGDLLLQTDPTAGATLFLGDTEADEAPGSQTVTATRTYSIGSIPVAQRTTASGSNVLYWLDTDVDGTVDLEVSGSTGAVTRRIMDPFGTPEGTASGPWSSDHGFLDQPASAFTGLTQLGARAYDPQLGRFLTVDPAQTPDPQLSNGYAYAANDPVALSEAGGIAPVDSSLLGDVTQSTVPSPMPTAPDDPWHPEQPS